MKDSSLAPGVMLACFAAGPLFVTSTALAMLYAGLPEPVLVSGRDLASFFAVLAPAFIVGGLLAILPTAVGASAMRALAERYENARAPIVWTSVGVVGGTAIALVFEAFSDPPVAFGLIATSALCARICRFPLRWD